MSDVAIRAALEAAAMIQCCDNWNEQSPRRKAAMVSFTSAAIAAFLRALPDMRLFAPNVYLINGEVMSAGALAAAVEAAAKGEG